jgi:hypothetical protein
MFVDHLLFKLKTPEGHWYELYLSGNHKGFPAGTIVLNYAIPIFYAGIEYVPSPPVSDEESKSGG